MSLGMSRRLISQEDAHLLENPNIPRSKFYNTWTRKMTFDAAFLVPFMVEEVVPGDHLKYDVTAYVRMQTALFPVFDNQRIDTFFFFVPNRLVWTNWKKMMGEQQTPVSSVAYTVPQYVSPAGGFAINTMADHMGLPCAGQITAGQTITVNALPFRAYFNIWDEWFRDQDIDNGIYPSTGDGPDGYSLSLLRRRKAHDYFTTARPWPQKFTAPTIPLAGTAPVLGIGFTTVDATAGPVSVEDAVSATSYSWYKPLDTAAGYAEYTSQSGLPNLRAQLSSATGIDINTFRQAFLVQQLLEKDARGGTRYIELVRNHFGVVSSDQRLQRPEYIGGGTTQLNMTPIAQTATGGSGVGTLAGAGTAIGQHQASYAAEEHGFIIGLINVRTELSYQQGIHKMWRRASRLDYYFPSLAGLGEQAILREEIYATGTDAEDTTVFGYQERFHELRTRMSEVTGMFRSKSSGNIDEWHFSQEFTSAPTLNSTFLQEDPPMNRVLAAGGATANMQYLADILIKREAVRPVPMYGTPAILGRF